MSARSSAPTAREKLERPLTSALRQEQTQFASSSSNRGDVTSKLFRHSWHSFLPLREFDQQLGFLLSCRRALASLTGFAALLRALKAEASERLGKSGSRRLQSSIFFAPPQTSRVWDKSDRRIPAHSVIMNLARESSGNALRMSR